ncbi:sensor histidine kinase [Janthinobacterium psychrotolerans]|uniref:histidine kinase n=1 Tax=Janthinobacterium psychrotolerans TaxID=1747903 RepID=A0A1A7C0B4_9BURK|nr:HAMP domain-containing protein [Janthinobacterium psychrotolerans]OBV38444.1 Signal transduction histidine kinase [Janthinobacterium psychrotolerans]
MAATIRRGLFAALAGFAVLLCLCYTGLAVVISYVTEDMLVQRLLEREAAAIRTRLPAAASGSDLITVYRQYSDLPAPVRQQFSPSAPRAEVFTGTGQHYHVLALDLQQAGRPERWYLLADVAPILVVSRLVREVGGVLIGVALALVGLALLLAWLLARRLVLPLQTLAQEAQALLPGHPPQFSARGRPDEIGFLARRLESTFTELQTALRREQAFARDVSHELRTPLTLMRNTLMLAAEHPLQALEQAQLQQGVDELGNTVELLFALARAEQIPFETVELRGCIEQCLLRLLEEHGWDASLLALDLPQRLPVRGHGQLVNLLLNNCLGNALFHGGPACQLTISFEHGCLSIHNTVPVGQAVRVQGFSHGQLLLARLAQVMQWEIRFHPGTADYRVDIVPVMAA